MKLRIAYQRNRNVSRYNYVIYILAFLACLVPRYVSTFKLHLGISISFYTLAVVFIWLMTTRRIVLKNRIEQYFFFIWAAFILFSVWRAEKIGVWAFYLDWVFTAILFQQIVMKYQDDDIYYFVVKAVTDALFIHLIIGLYEVTTNTYLFETENVNVSRRLFGHVAIGMFHNLNDYATFLTTMAPFAVYRLFNSKNVIEKLYSFFLTTASLYLIIVSESRGAILTLIVLMFVGIVELARKNNRIKLIILASLVVFVLALILDLAGIRASVFNLIRRNSINFAGNSDIARINLIRNGLYFLQRTYGFGVGAGNLYQWLAEESIYYIGGLRFIHNWYIEVLVTFGILFFTIYIVFHIKLLINLYKKKSSIPQLGTAFFLSFICFSIVSISSSSNVYSEWVWMYFVIVALFSISHKNTA